MQFAMQIEVYPTDADAVDAAAALAASHLMSGRAPATVALGGGRSNRAVMVALAARGDVPWKTTEWYLADERCAAAGDALGHAKVARESLFTPRGVAATLVHGPSLDAADPERVAEVYATALATRLGADGAFDLVVLGIGADGALGALTVGSAALEATEWVAVVPAARDGGPVCVSVTPALMARARQVIVTAVGPDTARAVAAALRDGQGPAARVLPSERVTWVVDRAAADELLKTATPA